MEQNYVTVTLCIGQCETVSILSAVKFQEKIFNGATQKSQERVI